MNQAEILRVEGALGVHLPEDYIRVLSDLDNSELPDEVSLIRDSECVIQSTMDYRRGFSELPEWPEKYVYIGDEADACPYALDTVSGSVHQLEKGNINKRIRSFQNLGQFVEYCAQVHEEPARRADKFNALYWLIDHPVIFVGVVFFLVLPLTFFGISQLFKWIASLF